MCIRDSATLTTDVSKILSLDRDSCLEQLYHLYQGQFGDLDCYVTFAIDAIIFEVRTCKNSRFDCQPHFKEFFELN